MDDGSLQSPITERAAAAEEALQDIAHPESRLRHDEAQLQPSRWWFASSAFPMIAGTLGPVASAFSICALGRQWRQHWPPDTDVDDASFIQDPAWLTIVNAIQLAMALVSNAFLLLNMAKRVRFTVAQPITIVGWYISAICLLSLNATAAGPLLEDLHDIPVDEVIWSQAFFYGIWAAVLYFVVASLMTVTFWGAATGRYRKDFDLTPSQRTLMLQTIMFLIYLLLGALVFSSIEGWNYLDAVYWADVTLFTIGFGDFHATSNLARALLFPYALIGVISLGLVVSSIRSMILERGRRQMGARIEEKNRRRAIKIITKRGKDAVLTPLPREPTIDEPPHGELERRRLEFQLMRKIQDNASLRRKWMAMAISTGSWLLLWLLGAYIFRECERKYQSWTYYDAIYFCFVSFTTIGYGDVSPVSNAGKSFFVFWSLMALPTMTILISNAGDTVVKFIQDATITVGNATILPGEEGFADSLKNVAYHVTCGVAFRHSKKMTAAPRAKHTRLSTVEKQPDACTIDGTPAKAKAPEDGSNAANSIDELRQPRRSSIARLQMGESEHQSLSSVRDKLDNLPTGHDFHLVLISEIHAVAKHTREAKPRRYTFEEWAWYLGLLGEDERDPDSHRKATPKQKHKHKHRRGHHHHKARKNGPRADDSQSPGGQGENNSKDGDQPPTTENEDGRTKWSWVGKRSPITGGREESDWILERLMDKLSESLWEAKTEAEGSVLESL